MFELKEYVMEIEKTGSFSQAADHLYVSQPSLSASIKRLEERIGEPLFDRSTHPVRLTECGAEYLRAATAIAAEEDNFSAYLEEHRNCRTGALTLGGSNVNVSYVIPPLLMRFRETYPQIDVTIVESGIDDLQQRLIDGSVDFVVDSCNMESDRIHEYRYRPETLLLAVPERFSCNEEMRIYRLTLAEVQENRHTSPDFPCPPLHLLGSTPFISMTPETDTGKRSKELFKRAGWRPNSVLSFSQQSTAFTMASAGIGAAILSDVLLKSIRFQPELVYYKLDPSESLRYIKFYQKKGRRQSFAMRSFLSVAQELSSGT